MLKMRSTNLLLNSLANYPTILREIKNHLRKSVKKQLVCENAYKAILQEEDNNEVEDITEKVPKQQQANILRNFCSGPKKGFKKKEKKAKTRKDVCCL